MNTLERITQLRVARGWSGYQLANNAGLPQSTISAWYRKNMLPSIGSLEKICEGFGITLSAFFADGSESVVLTSEQKKLLESWNKLTPRQKETLLAFLEQF